MLASVVLVPVAEFLRLAGDHVLVLQRLVRLRREERLDALEVGGIEHRRGVLRGREFLFDQLAELLRADGLHQDLDTRLVNVVATTFEVVHAQDGFEIREQILLRQELANHVTDHGRATEAAADQHFETDFALLVLHEVQANVVHA